MSSTRYLTLIDTLARFSLKADARRYFLGYVWWIMEPLLYVCVFYIVFYQVLGTRQPDYLAFLVVGKLAFVWFSKSVNQSANSLLLAKGLIGQQDMPKAVFPLAVLHEGFYKQIPVFALLVTYLLLDGYSSTKSWLLLPVLILAQYLLIAACSLIAALLVCVQRDFAIMINLGTMLLLFLSGIFWDIRSLADGANAELFLTYNPLAFLLDAYRQVLMYDTLPDISHLLTISVVCSVAAGVCLMIYQRLNYWIARRVVTL